MIPGRGVAVVRYAKLLGDTHVHVVIGELEAQDFLGNIEHYWIGLCLNQEVKWPIVDVVCDGSSECLGLLTAKDDVEASFLPRWDDLREWAASLQLRVLIHEKANVDVLSQIVGNDEALGC